MLIPKERHRLKTQHPGIMEEACLVPVRHFPIPSLTSHFGDVSEVNRWEMPSHLHLVHVTRNTLAQSIMRLMGTRQGRGNAINLKL